MSRRYRYTEEEIDYVRSIAPGRYNAEIAELFNKKFGTKLTEGQMKSLKSNHGIRSNMTRKRRTPPKTLFTDEQEEFVKKNVKGLLSQELADLVNDKFGLSVTGNQINTWKANRGLTSGVSTVFKKGQKAWNKGMKGLDLAGENGRKTQFKKGQKPLNYRPVGSERICSKDGYILVKVQDGGLYQERWRLKHTVVWEKVHGKVPKNHVVAFLDNDKTNTDIDNLVLLTRGELALMNRNGYFSDNPEVTMAGINLVRLETRITDVDLKGNDEEYFKGCIEKAKKNGIKEQTFMARLKRGWSLYDAVSKPLHSRVKLRRSNIE